MYIYAKCHNFLKRCCKALKLFQLTSYFSSVYFLWINLWCFSQHLKAFSRPLYPVYRKMLFTLACLQKLILRVSQFSTFFSVKLRAYVFLNQLVDGLFLSMERSVVFYFAAGITVMSLCVFKILSLALRKYASFP